MNPRFLHIIKSSKPVVVDFYAYWCRPCREVSPILKKIKKEIRGIRIIKVNVDTNPLIASHFNIQHLPTLMVFENGNPVWSHEGVFSPEKLKAVLRNKMD